MVPVLVPILGSFLYPKAKIHEPPKRFREKVPKEAIGLSLGLAIGRSCRGVLVLVVVVAVAVALHSV
jgi:hypothetical protein